MILHKCDHCFEIIEESDLLHVDISPEPTKNYDLCGQCGFLLERDFFHMKTKTTGNWQESIDYDKKEKQVPTPQKG